MTGLSASPRAGSRRVSPMVTLVCLGGDRVCTFTRTCPRARTPRRRAVRGLPHPPQPNQPPAWGVGVRGGRGDGAVCGG